MPRAQVPVLVGCRLGFKVGPEHFNFLLRSRAHHHPGDEIPRPMSQKPKDSNPPPPTLHPRPPFVKQLNLPSHTELRTDSCTISNPNQPHLQTQGWVRLSGVRVRVPSAPYNTCLTKLVSVVHVNDQYYGIPSQKT